MGLILSVSIRIPVEDEAEALKINDAIVNTTKQIKDVSISSVATRTLTRPEDLRKT